MPLGFSTLRPLGSVWPQHSRGLSITTGLLQHAGRTNTLIDQHVPNCIGNSEFCFDPVTFSRLFVSWPAKVASAPRPDKISLASMGQKRPASESEGKSAKSAKPGSLVNPLRWRELKEGVVGNGPVLYWCANFRDSNTPPCGSCGPVSVSSLPCTHARRAVP
jgi:hypothetical protein